MVYYVVATSIGALAGWRWWYWKREAYRTRDEAMRIFQSVQESFDRPRSG